MKLPTGRSSYQTVNEVYSSAKIRTARGTTVKDGPDGKALWDISILEAVDPDGDVTWAIIAQEYAKPPYDFYFIGGTGKWYGITGQGEATGMVKDRVDHYNMLTWKISWKVVREE